MISFLSYGVMGILLDMSYGVNMGSFTNAKSVCQFGILRFGCTQQMCYGATCGTT